MRTTQSTLSSAEICRREDWLVGSVLLGVHDGRELRVRVTAIGRKLILAELVSIDNLVVDGIHDEAIYDLHARDWRRVD